MTERDVIFHCPQCNWAYSTLKFGVRRVPIHNTPERAGYKRVCAGSDTSPVRAQLDLLSLLPQPGRPAA